MKKFTDSMMAAMIAFAAFALAPYAVQAQVGDASAIASLNGAILAQNSINNFEQINGGILRGALPSDNNLALLAKSGVKTIIDLRMEGPGIKHEKKIVEELGMKYVHVPFGFINPNKNDTQKVLALLTDKQQLPAYVHCAQGADRTGMIIGMYRRLYDNWEFEPTYKEMRKHHFKPFFVRLRDAVRDCKKDTIAQEATTALEPSAARTIAR